MRWFEHVCRGLDAYDPTWTPNTTDAAGRRYRYEHQPLAEAACGDFSSANARLERVLDQQYAIGASSVWLGLTLEARARVAIWSDKAATFERFSSQAAREYRRGPHSPLGALLEEAARRGFQSGATLAAINGVTEHNSLAPSSADSRSLVTRALAGAAYASDRGLRVLRLLCDARGAGAGHLFLVDTNSVRAAASFGASQPEPALRTLVSDYVAEQRGELDGATEIMSDTHEPPQLASPIDSRAQALDYELMLLASDAAGGEARIIGVAAVASDTSRSRAAKPLKLLAALAGQLLEHGDAAGMMFD